MYTHAHTHMHTHTHTHTHTCTHTHTFTHTHIHTYIQSKSKAKSLAAERSCRPSEALGAWARIRRFEPVLANPPGGGLVPRRWGCTMLKVIIWALKVPPGPHPLVDMDSSLTFASPVITRYPLMLWLDGLEQCE